MIETTVKQALSPYAISLALFGGMANGGAVAIGARFGLRIGVLPSIAFGSIVMTIIMLITLLFVPRGFTRLVSAIDAPKWMWAGGLLATFMGYAATKAGPEIGITSTLALLISGQLAAAAVIDRFGVFGLERISVSRTRILAIVILASGSLLSLYR